jgi:superfamily II DNA or RNA helicase
VRERGYQLESRLSIFRAWEDSRSTLLSLPTGCGKTVVSARVIEKVLKAAPNKCVLFIAHRQELIWQARDKIKEVLPWVNVDVEMGEYKSSNDGSLFHPRAQVVVSTVQTLCAGGDGGGRIGKFDPSDFAALITDEAHHSTSPSYRRIHNYMATNELLKILGITATPDRADEESLGQIYESVALMPNGRPYEILDAINQGWLVPIEQQMVNIEELDFSNIKTTAGDLNGADLAAVMEAEKNLHGVASATIDIIGDKRGIGFASSVNHAATLSNIFNRHRSGMSAMICGKTEPTERKQIIEAFTKGGIQWLWNCGVLTEGFDNSDIEVIAQARPTKSRALYAQMIGRGTRPHKSIAHAINDVPADALRRVMIKRSVKPSCLVIDFVGNSGRHKLMTTADILGGNVSDEAIESAINLARRSGKAIRMDRTLDEQEKIVEENKKRKLAEESRKAKLVGRAKYTRQSVDPFDVLQIKPNKPRGWDDKKVLTEKQRGILRRAGMDPDKMEYARAKQLVGIVIERWTNNKCSIKQADILKRFGYSTEMTFAQAQKTLDALQKNKWKKPSAIVPAMPMRKTKPAGVDDIPF